MSVFKVKQPPSVNANETRAISAPYGGKAVAHSRQSGDPLPDASKDTPSHNPLLPWPQPCLGVDHLPYKTKK